MPYCTLANIKDVIPEAFLIQLTNDAGGAAIDQTRIDKAILDADEVIKGYLRSRYPVPLEEPIPGLINKISTDISIFNLYSRRPELDTPENVVTRYKDAITMLKDIQKGIISLGSADEEPLPDTVGVYKSNKTEEDRIFNKSLLDSMP